MYIHCFKEKQQPCHAGLEQLKLVQQAMSKSHENGPFDEITESSVEDAAPETHFSKLPITLGARKLF